MHLSRTIGFLVVACIGVHSLGSAQSNNWERYRPGTLRARIAAEAASAREGCDSVRPCTIISAVDFPTETHVKYLGEFRKLTVAEREFIADWARATRMPDSVATIFTHAIHVQEADTAFWLPIQGVLMEPFRNEVQKGKRASLLVIYLGAFWPSNESLQWGFLINEFAAEQ